MQVPCAMVDAGDGVCIEIFGNGSSDEIKIGTYPHMCYEVEDIENIMKYLNKKGYASTDSMGNLQKELYIDFTMSKECNIIWRCGFIVGPCGEIIEFLQDMSC